jgi:hypothetical protein
MKKENDGKYGSRMNRTNRRNNIECPSDLFDRELFYCADCVLNGQLEVIGYRLIKGQPRIDRSIQVGRGDLTDVFLNFSVEIDRATYAGGEASAHGSCGFFYKKTAGRLIWAAMSMESSPFISVDIFCNRVAFLSSTGHKWVVNENDIFSLHVEFI